MNAGHKVFETYQDRRLRLSGGAPARKRSTLVVPERASPPARLVFELMKKRGVVYDELEAKSGVLRSTIKAIRSKNFPTLSTIEALLGALGHEFVPVPKLEALSPELRADLAPLAAKHGESIAHLTAYVVEQGALGRALSDDARARIALWREKADHHAESRHAGNVGRERRRAERAQIEAPPTAGPMDEALEGAA